MGALPIQGKHAAIRVNDLAPARTTQAACTGQ